MVGRGECGLEQTNPKYVFASDREVAAPEVQQHVRRILIKQTAGLLVCLVVERHGHVVVEAQRASSHWHVAEHNPSGTPGMPGRVAGHQPGLGNDVVINEQQDVAAGQLGARLAAAGPPALRGSVTPTRTRWSDLDIRLSTAVVSRSGPSTTTSLGSGFLREQRSQRRRQDLCPTTGGNDHAHRRLDARLTRLHRGDSKRTPR